MSIDDKFDAKADEVEGKVKQTTGRLTNDRELETEGKVVRTKGILKQAVEKLKDVFKKA